MKKILTLTALSIGVSSAFAGTDGIAMSELTSLTTPEYRGNIVGNSFSIDGETIVVISKENAKITQTVSNNTSFPLETFPNKNVADGCAVYSDFHNQTSGIPPVSLKSNDLKIIDNRVYLNSTLYGVSNEELSKKRYTIFCSKDVKNNTNSTNKNTAVRVEFRSLEVSSKIEYISKGAPISSNVLDHVYKNQLDNGVPDNLTGIFGIPENKTTTFAKYLLAYIPSTGALYYKGSTFNTPTGAQWQSVSDSLYPYEMQDGDSYNIDLSMEKSILEQVEVELYLGYLPKGVYDTSKMKFLNVQPRRSTITGSPKGTFSSIGINPIFVSVPK